jgi:hypothetical protein
VSVRFGYKASAEQFAPRELIEYSVRAERLGPEEGTPPAIAVYQDDKAVAYLEGKPKFVVNPNPLA